MKTRHKLLFGLAGGLLVLAACDGSDGVAPVAAQSQFGPAFLAAFNAAPNSIPVEPGPIVFRGTTGPSLTGTPVDL